MVMTITEKILAAHAGKERVEPHELIMAKIDVFLGNDLSTPGVVAELQRIRADRVCDPGKIVLVPDHFTPNKDIKSAENSQIMKEFAKRHKVSHYFEIGEMGIEHVLLPEKGIVLPGDVIVGGDSHTCTYGAMGAFATGVGTTDLAAGMLKGELWFRVPESMKFVYYGKLQNWVDAKDLILYTIGDIGADGALYRAMEFTGEMIDRMRMSGRLTMANMAIEAGAKNGIFHADKVTEKYLEGRAERPYRVFKSDPEARYREKREYDVGKIEPQISFPHSPSNTKPLSEVGNIALDEVLIGSCTNGRIEDLRVAARVLKGNRTAPYVRLIIIPGTQEVYRQAMQEGLIEIFLQAKAVISTPTCGPCAGGHMGILGKGERAIATTNRNFLGRMGHVESEVYLSNPAVAAASAVKGRIASPEEVVKD